MIEPLSISICRGDSLGDQTGVVVGEMSNLLERLGT